MGSIHFHQILALLEGGRIKQYRYEHGLNHKALGELLGVNASTIGSWEADEFEPHRKMLKKIKKMLYAI